MSGGSGFLTALGVGDVIAALRGIPALQGERVSLDDADGRTLYKTVIAPEDVPPADRAGMDGYAVIAADLFGASENAPVWLDCAGTVPIDRPADFAVHRGQCAAVATGSRLPPGADAVIMVEHTLEFGSGVIEMRRAVPPGSYVLRRGEDAAAQNPALAAGTLIRPQEVGLLAALGIENVDVFRRPRVVILSTGDELVPRGAVPEPGQIRDVNSHTLACLVRRAGAVPIPGAQVRDDVGDLMQALHAAACAGADVILLSGGSSVGVRDLTIQALQQWGKTDIFCHGVAISPGKPLILARRDNLVIWGLPGQVTSAQVVMRILGTPFLRHLAGAGSYAGLSPFDQSRWPSRKAILSRNTASQHGREEYIRVRLLTKPEGLPLPVGLPLPEGLPLADPLPGLSGLLRTLIQADGLVRIDASLEGLEAGALVDVLLFGSL